MPSTKKRHLRYIHTHERSIGKRVLKSLTYHPRLSTTEKNNYIDELKNIYNVVKKHKHSNGNILSVEDLRIMDARYLISVLKAVLSEYKWASIYSLPYDETTFIRAFIRLIHRIVQTSETEPLQTSKAKQHDRLQPTSFERSLFKRYIDQTGITIVKSNTHLFAPSDTCLNQPFWKMYFDYVKNDSYTLQDMLLNHRINNIRNILKKPSNIKAVTANHDTLNIQHNKGEIYTVNRNTILHSETYTFPNNSKCTIHTIDNVLGVSKPYGMTTLQKKTIESLLTSLCMLISKKYCHQPCVMSSLTCTYASSNSSSVNADMKYLRMLTLQSIKDYLLLVPGAQNVAILLIPKLESIIGTIDLYRCIKSFRHVVFQPNKLLGRVAVFLKKVNALPYFSYFRVNIINQAFLITVFAPIVEEIIMRGGIKTVLEKIISIFPPPTLVNHLKKHSKKKSATSKQQIKHSTKTKKRRSSTFENLFEIDESDEHVNHFWLEWAVIVFVSLWFGLIHLLNHQHKNNYIYANRFNTIVHIFITSVLGMSCHLLASHHGLHVAIFKHFAHNFLCTIAPTVITADGFQELNPIIKQINTGWRYLFSK